MISQKYNVNEINNNKWADKRKENWSVSFDTYKRKWSNTERRNCVIISAIRVKFVISY